MPSRVLSLGLLSDTDNGWAHTTFALISKLHATASGL